MTKIDAPYINAKIIDIKPGSGYEGRIYDQTVFLELPDGKTIDVLDDKMICKSDMVGVIKKVTILVALANVKKVKKPSFGVMPAGSDNLNRKPSGSGHIFYGRIEGKIEEFHDLIVNVDYGLICSDVKGDLKDYDIGDFVEIYSVRTDLFKIYD